MASDRASVCAGRSRCSAHRSHTKLDTFNTRRYENLTHPRDSSGLSPMVPHLHTHPHRDGDTEPELYRVHPGSGSMCTAGKAVIPPYPPRGM